MLKSPTNLPWLTFQPTNQKPHPLHGWVRYEVYLGLWHLGHAYHWPELETFLLRFFGRCEIEGVPGPYMADYGSVEEFAETLTHAKHVTEPSVSRK